MIFPGGSQCLCFPTRSTNSCFHQPGFLCCFISYTCVIICLYLSIPSTSFVLFSHQPYVLASIHNLSFPLISATVCFNIYSQYCVTLPFFCTLLFHAHTLSFFFSSLCMCATPSFCLCGGAEGLGSITAKSLLALADALDELSDGNTGTVFSYTVIA